MDKSEAYPLISIIVPVYNVAEYLGECIDSIISQTLSDWELLLIDDGSDDGSGALCDAYVSEDDRITCIHQDNRGPSAARNAGLDLARGKYIAMVDSDDVLLDKRYLEILLNTTIKEDADISFCTLKAFLDEPPVDTDNTDHCEYVVTTGPDFCSRKYHEYDSFFGCPFAKLAKSDLYKDLRFPENIVFSEDNAMAHRLYYPCRKIALISNPMYGYRTGKTGQSECTDLGRKIDDLKKSFSDRIAYYSSQGRGDLAIMSEKEMFYHMSYAIGQTLRKTPQGFPISEKYGTLEILETMDNIYGRSALYNLFNSRESFRDSELFETFQKQEIRRSHVLLSIIGGVPLDPSDETNKHSEDLTSLFPIAYEQHVFLKLLGSIQNHGITLELDDQWAQRRDFLISRAFRMNSEVGGIVAFARSRSVPLTPLGDCSSSSADLYSLPEDDARYFLAGSDHMDTLGTHLEGRGFASNTDGLFHIWESKDTGQIILIDHDLFYGEYDDSRTNDHDPRIALYRLLAQYGRMRFSHIVDIYRICIGSENEVEDIAPCISLANKLMSGCHEDELTTEEQRAIMHVLRA